MGRTSPFPPYDLEETLLIAKTIWDNNAGKPMRRLTIFDSLGRSPDSSTSRQLVTASSGYGLTQGSYAAETISLTERGRAIVELNDPQAKLDAVLGVDIFAEFFEHYRNASLPSIPAAIDFFMERDFEEGPADACLEVILKTGEQVTLIQEFSGTKRIVSPEHALETLSGYMHQPGTPSLVYKEEPVSLDTQILAADAHSVNAQGYQVPSVHIDIQIHISADAKPEQIDQIFASMAKHLYGRE